MCMYLHVEHYFPLVMLSLSSFYLNEGFLHLQKLVDEAIIEVLTNQSVDIDVKVRVSFVD